MIGLTDEQVQGVIENGDKFVADTEALEHGQVDVTDGLVAMIDDLLEILKILGVDWTAPSELTLDQTYCKTVRFQHMLTVIGS